jgi:hypothetical protein
MSVKAKGKAVPGPRLFEIEATWEEVSPGSSEKETTRETRDRDEPGDQFTGDHNSIFGVCKVFINSG